MNRVSRVLATRMPASNWVFSPHAILKALVWSARGDERRQRELMAYLEQGVPYSALAAELERVEAHLEKSVEPVLPRDGADHPLFDYSSVIELGNGSGAQVSAEAPSAASSSSTEYLTRAVVSARQRSPAHARGTLVSALDVRLSGVPVSPGGGPRVSARAFGANPESTFVTLEGGPGYECSQNTRSAWWAAENEGPDTFPPRHVLGRGFVTFSEVSFPGRAPADLPLALCAGQGPPALAAAVHLTFSVPTFCARTDLELDQLAGALQLQRVADRGPAIVSPARLAFDHRGTFNLPKRASPSPALSQDLARELPKHEFEVTKPFFVTVHDWETGTILYVARIRDRGDPSRCH